MFQCSLLNEPVCWGWCQIFQFLCSASLLNEPTSSAAWCNFQRLKIQNSPISPRLEDSRLTKKTLRKPSQPPIGNTTVMGDPVALWSAMLVGVTADITASGWKEIFLQVKLDHQPIFFFGGGGVKKLSKKFCETQAENFLEVTKHTKIFEKINLHTGVFLKPTTP